MDYAIATTSIIPLRASADDRSEMVSQLLFGEIVRIDEIYLKWCKITNVFDGYMGWVDPKQLTIIDEQSASKLLNSEVLFTKEIITNVYDLETKQEISLLYGSHLMGYSNGKITILNKDVIIRESPLALKINTTREAIITNAKKFIGAPYLWGGKSPFGVDCSGLTQTIFKVCGIKLPRDASEQAKLGNLIDFVGDSQEGDLAFFENEIGDVVHVGIVLKNQRILHASGQVRVDILDHNGIFNEKTKEYTHKLRFIKSYL